MPAFSDPARRSGAAKSKEEAEGQQACAAARDSAGSPTGEAQATEHGAAYRIVGPSATSECPRAKFTQGRSGASHLAVVYPDTARKDRRANAGGQVPLAQFAADQFKDDLAGQLATIEPGAWHVHFPRALRGNFGVGPDERNGDPPHLFFEQLVAERRTTRGKWEKPHQGVRNEAMDLLVGRTWSRTCTASPAWTGRACRHGRRSGSTIR